MTTPQGQPEKGKKVILKEKIRKHIEDKNDIISEADLRDVEIGTEAMSKKETEKKIKETKKKIENTSPTDQPGTPWDILSDD